MKKEQYFLQVLQDLKMCQSNDYRSVISLPGGSAAESTGDECRPAGTGCVRVRQCQGQLIAREVKMVSPEGQLSAHGTATGSL